MPKITVSELARSIGGTVVGDGDRLIAACNTLANATIEQVSILHNPKYAKDLETTQAGCVILAPGGTKGLRRAPNAPPLTAIEAKNTYYAWQQVMVQLMGFKRHPTVGISPLASIHPAARLGQNVQVHPFAVIGENVALGDNTIVYPHATLMAGARVGKDCVLFPRVTIYEECIIGDRCQINAGTVIGSDGFAYAQANGIHHKMPQAGGLIIEDDVEIGSNSIIERGALNPTIVGRGSKIGSVVIVGHNCRIGPGNLIISATCISGSTTTGQYVVMAGQVGVAGHLDIPDFVKIGAQAGVVSNPDPNTELLGSPAMEAHHARRVYVQFMQLPDLAKRVKELEKKLAKIEVPPAS